MIATQQPQPLPPDEELVLEPTAWPESETEASGDSHDAEASQAEAEPTNDSELTVLLRSRLRAAAGFLALTYAALFIFGLVSPDTVYRLAAYSVAVRCVLGAAVFGLLSSSLVLGYRQLRWLEYAFFGAELAVGLYAQYVVNMRLVDRGDLVGLVTFEKNGVLRVFMLMIIYGVFIPNRPKITARVVLTMAIAPIIILAMVLEHQFQATAISQHMAETQNVISNAIFLLIGAALAIVSAHLLNGLRHELSTVRQLGQYRLLHKLGAGGMGEVYLAEHQLLKRPCALKLINPDVDDNTIALARFEREVQSAAMLMHPNTIEIFDYGRADDGTFYYVMEYLPGMSVSDLVRRAGPLPPGRAVYLMRQVSGALAEAHRMGLIHRDLKPGNIFIAILGGQCDVAKVLDFGLVKRTDPESLKGPQLTLQYTVSGTPSYMSPEQAKGEPTTDGRIDLYSLGAILYFMLTGKPPFERDSPMSLMIAHASELPVPPSKLNPEVPADLEAVVLRCLAKTADERYADARELERALADCACAADWDAADAEQWWLEQAAAQEAVATSPEPATA